MTWFRSAEKPVEETVTPEMPQPLPEAPPGGLAILLDDSGRVLHLAGPLAPRLARHAEASPLRDYLAPSSAAQVPRDLNDWLGHSLDLDFYGDQRNLLATRGWLQARGDGWLLLLQAVDDLLAQARIQEVRRHALSQSARLAERLRYASASDLQHATGEALAELAQGWKIPALALALPEASGTWRIYADHSAYHVESPWPVGTVLRSDPAWLDTASFRLPYQGRDGQSAWLLCLDYEPARQVPELGPAEWQQLFGQLASTLLARLREQSEEDQHERLEALQGLLGAGWWEYQEPTRELHLAPALSKSLGLPDVVPLDDWLQGIHPADRDEFRVRLNALATAGQGFIQCVRIKVAEAYIWHRVQGQVQGRGSRRRLCGLLLDISDIKAQENAASAAHARLRNLLDSAPAVVYVQRYVEGALHLEFCSESLRPLLGWSLAELQAGLLAEQVHPEDHATFFERSRRLLRDGSVSCRYRLRNRQGHYHWLLDEAKLLRDELGQPVEVVGVWLDVSEAMLAAERIRESEERYRVLVEDSPAMICRYRPDLSLVFANRPLADYLERTPEQLQGDNLGNWLSDEQRDGFRQRLIGLTPEQPVSTAEICLQLPGRDHAWWVWADRGIFDEHGRLLEIQAVGRDNTEVRKAQQQLFQGAKMATLGEMATGMAHEMNQPLNVMRMAVANVLKRLAGGDAPVDYLQDKLLRIESQVQRAAKIVEHMRVFGRRSEVERQLFDPLHAIEGALSLLREGLQGKGVEVRLSTETPQALVHGHADQLEQVLINLMVNARDALLSFKEKQPELKPWIAVHCETSDGWVHLRVEDNAGGIDPRLLERIFEPFFTTKPVGKGTGLGLSVSFGIVQQMGGRLHARNTEQGACFHIDLPVQKPGSSAPEIAEP
ncbi:PAS domain-containing protein [Pseudomonas sp. GD03944]|uniref:PAS domain-containing sensor histidine kinase n=1 Tax=Pseudomonas sp. GD03944 TaxID=2975409 RepID=UPI00244B8772|nr:PAS domain-containing protein [Pseudomonas sp. GD03944]MDH1264997.1 PAS domain-containing protein [Pseudomonas sp. GD03944]